MHSTGMWDSISKRIDFVASRLGSISAVTDPVKVGVEEAADYVSSIQSESVQSKLYASAAKRIKASNGTGSLCLTINIPEPYAGRFPESDTYNKGFKPHLTVLYVGKGLSDGELSTAIFTIRNACKNIKPFRLFVDTQSGLDDFGDGEDGEKALWVPSRSDPKGHLEHAHRAIRSALEREGIKVNAHDEYRPHVTWAYVKNDVDKDVVRRMDNHVSDRFPGGVWFDVNSITIDMPDDTEKTVLLNGLAGR